MALGELERIFGRLKGQLEELKAEIPEVTGLMDRATAALQMGQGEAEAYRAMMENMLAQLHSGAASVEQVMREFNVKITANYIPGQENLRSELAKTLGEIKQNQQALAELAVDLATGKVDVDEVLEAIGKGSPVVAKLIEDLLKLSKNTGQAIRGLEDLRKSFANKDKGGSALDSLLDQIQEKLSAGDLADMVGSGLNGGRL